MGAMFREGCADPFEAVVHTHILCESLCCPIIYLKILFFLFNYLMFFIRWIVIFVHPSLVCNHYFFLIKNALDGGVFENCLN